MVKFKIRNAILIIVTVIVVSGCGLKGWFPGWDDNPKTSTTQPAQGCNQDINVHYKNNCSKELIMYFIEVNPGTTVNCESLEDFGSIKAICVMSAVISEIPA